MAVKKSKMARDPGDRKFSSDQKSTSLLISRTALLSAFLAIVVAAFSWRYWLGTDEAGSDIQRLLTPRISLNASIVPAGSPTFKHLTARWSQYDAPSVNVAVSVATAEDVQQTVCHFRGL